jgi:hypothetical protein
MKDQMNGEGVGENNVWMIGGGMLVAGLVVGFLVGWFGQKNMSQVAVVDDLQNSTSTAIVATSTVPALENTYKTIDVLASISVDDQRAGSLVFVKHTEVSKPTWIAVREVVDGSIGNILGAEMVTVATDDVPVTLLRSTVVGGQYAVFLYQDDGNGEFDFKTDLLVTQNNVPVATVFTAQ